MSDAGNAPAALEPCSTGVPPKLIMFFTYRTLMDPGSLDLINYEGWREVLDAFGYASLTLETCSKDLSEKTPYEVMTALCPFTTKAEWGPLLNKRDVRLERELKGLCYAEVMPLDGLKDFLIDCARHAETTVVMLSPFRETVSRMLLETSQLTSFVDMVVSYTEHEFGVLEACERLNVPPPQIPQNLRHRWEDGMTMRSTGSALYTSGVNDDKRDEDPTHTTSSGQNASNEQQRVDFLLLDCSTDGIRFATHHYCVPSIALTAALIDAESDDVNGHVPSSVQAELLAAGASFTVPSYTSLRYDYLRHLWTDGGH